MVKIQHTSQQEGLYDLIRTQTNLKSEANLSESRSNKVVKLFFDEISEDLVVGQQDRDERPMQHLWKEVYGFYTGPKPQTGEGRALPPKKLVL